MQTTQTMCPTCHRPLNGRDESYSDSYLSMYRRNRSLAAGGRKVELTIKEWDVLDALIRCRGYAIATDALLEWCWGEAYTGDVYLVKWHISRLRKKLEAAAGAPSPIKTLYGFGYIYEVADPNGRPA